LVPHLLSMTATPIPRTLALTFYGDLDLSLLDQMPEGRKPIITEIVTKDRRENTYEKIREEMKMGRQLYVICPRIDEPDPEKETAILVKSVKEEAKRLKKDIFPEYNIGILHSKMNPTEKEKIMLEFKDKKLDILVATSVVEVGVNVVNASLIIIEGAERFGLAQLHQLRGRVLRGTHQPYCFVFADSKTEKTIERLNALKTARNGFELAEFDLKQRGSGELYGGKQWGVSDLAMEAIKNIKMVEAASLEATKIIEEDYTLSKHKELKNYLETRSQKVHFE
ncbi:MAG: helicase-related protein, partial [Minisyncoccia bacterium]